MKKVLSMILAVVMLISLFPASAFAKEVYIDELPEIAAAVEEPAPETQEAPAAALTAELSEPTEELPEEPVEILSDVVVDVVEPPVEEFDDSQDTYVTVSFDMNGCGEQTEPLTLIAGTPVQEPEAPEAEGYVFCGWYAEPECVTPWDFEAPVNEDTVLYACWEVDDLAVEIKESEALGAGDWVYHFCNSQYYQKRLDSGFTGGVLESQSYWLDADITLTEPIVINAGSEVKLCLNGHVINGNGACRVITNNGTLDIYDCNRHSTGHPYRVQSNGCWVWDPSASGGDYYSPESPRPSEGSVIIVPGGAITGGYSSEGGGIYNNGELTGEGFNIIGNVNTSSSFNADQCGSALFNHNNATLEWVYVIGHANEQAIRSMGTGYLNLNNCDVCFNTMAMQPNGSVITVTGGNINGNYSGSGACINMWQGTVKLIRTTMKNNSAGTNGMGGAITYGAGTLEIYDTTITGNTAKTGAGIYCSTYSPSLTVGGSTVITGNCNLGTSNQNNVYLESGRTINVATGEYAPNMMDIGVTLVEGTGAVTGSNSSDMSGYFTSDKAKYATQNSDGNVVTVTDAAVKIIETGRGYDSLAKAVSAAADGQTIVLTKDSSCSSSVRFPSDKSLTLDLNGKTFAVGDNGIVVLGNLTIRDSTEAKNGCITTDNSVTHYRAVLVYGGKLTLESGNISGCTASNDSKGMAVSVDGNGTFEMKGGKLSGNTSTGGGGAVYVYNGNFEMSGGEISGNTAPLGGGVFVENGSFTMSGGVISGNTAPTGGGVSMQGGSFTMSGGKLSGNTSSDCGGAVYISGGSFTMSDGEISGNKGKYGGGVELGGGSFTMSGGKISGNTGTDLGGGVHIYIGNVTMTGGEISGNTSPCGGISIQDGTFTMTGGSVTDNTSPYGGVYYFGSGTVNVSGTAKISGNTTDGTDSCNLYLASGKTVTVSDALTEGASIGVTAEGTLPRVVSTGAGAYASKFIADDLNYEVTDYNGDAAIIEPSKAMISETGVEYISLAAAVEAAADGQTIILTKDSESSDKLDFPSDKTLTLDLNGKTFAVGDNGIVVLGNLTIKDSTEAKNGCITTNNKVTHYRAVVVYGALTLESGNISGCTGSNGTGQAVLVNGGSFTMSGGEISDNTAPLGGGVFVENGSFTMSGGEISGNKATGRDDNTVSGGGVYMSGGTFTMSGGTIKNNAANSIDNCNGGGVGISGGTFNFEGGTIEGNTCSESGGGVKLTGNGIFNMTGANAVIKNNTAGGNGNGVQMDSSDCKFNMSAGKISGNKNNGTSNVYDAAVLVYSGTMTMSGGEISGNTSPYGGVYVLNTGVLNVSGTAKISGNTKADEATPVNLFLASGKIANVSEALTEGADIGVTLAAVIGAVTGDNGGNDYSAYFTSDNTKYFAYNDGGTVKLAHAHTDKAGNITVFDKALTATGGELASGSYLLSNNLTLTDSLTVAAGSTVNICLNGHVITRTGNGSLFVNNGTLNICDCETTTVHYFTSDSERWIWNGDASATGYSVTGGLLTGAYNPETGDACFGSAVQNYGTLGMDHINAVGNRSGNWGGAVFSRGADSAVTVTDCNLSHNYAGYSGGALDAETSGLNVTDTVFEGNRCVYWGGAVDIGNTSNAVFTGCTFTGNSSVDNFAIGGAVNSYGSAFTMTDCTVTGNSSTGNGGGVYLDADSTVTFSGTTEVSGNTKGSTADNLYLAAAGKAAVSDPAEGMSIGVTLEDGIGAVTGSNSADISGCFTSDNADYSAYNSAGNAVLIGNCAAKIRETGYGYESLAAAVTAASDKQTIVLTKDSSAASSFAFPEQGKSLTLDLNGKTFAMGDNGIVVIGNLTIKDSTEAKDGCITTNNNVTRYRAVVVYGSLTLESGNISGCTASNGGGEAVLVNGGSFEMKGGKISGNTFTDSGAGVNIIEGGSFTMSGGEISGNTALLGGGIAMDSGTFTMSGGEISGNTATGYDSSYVSGGGVYMSGGSFTMSGGTIEKNSGVLGGGVGVSGGTFEMCGGVISGNTASNGGGGIKVGKGTFKLYAVEGTDIPRIENNISGGNGNAVQLDTLSDSTVGDAQFIMSDGIITGNTCSGETGKGDTAVRIQHGTFTMTGGTITGNTSSCGGVRIENGSVFNVSGTAKITGNTDIDGTTPVNLYLANGKIATVSATLTEGADIGVTLESGIGAVTGSNSADISGYFTSDNTGYSAYNSAGNTVHIGNCAAKISETDYSYETLADAVAAAADGQTIILTKDSESSDKLDFPSDKTLTLDLNGKTFAVGDWGVTILGTVTVKDSTEAKNGCITTNNNVTHHRAVCAYGGKLILESGNISGCTASDDSKGVAVAIDQNGTFEMKGGKLSDNTSTGGGAVYVMNGSFTMSGGEISGNTALLGGAVYIDPNGSFTISGGEISGNTATGHTSCVSGGGVYMSGGTFEMTGGSIKNNKATDASAGGGGVGIAGGTMTMSGGSIEGNTSAFCGGGIRLCTSASAVFNMTGENAVIKDNKSKGSGNGISMDGSCEVNMSAGTITGNINNGSTESYGTAVEVYAGTMTMTGGSVTGNTSSNGGVYVANNGVLNVSGTAKISGNTSNGTTPVNLYLENGKSITVSEALTEGASIGVTTVTVPTIDAPSPVTGNNGTNDYSDFFFSDNESYGVSSVGGAVKLTVPVSYLAPQYIDESDVTKGIKDEWLTESVNKYDIVTASTTDLTDGWWIVNADVTTSGLTVGGDAKLIVLDGKTLTANGINGSAGINVSNKLAVYAQSTGDTAGKIVATGHSMSQFGGGAGINGNITVNGCNITATGAEYGGAGINGAVTINGGDITATGLSKAPGIGGTVTINGGDITATGASSGAGIGGGYNGNSGKIVITGGIVKATGGGNGGDTGGAGIGGGYNGNGNDITITGGDITATGGSSGAGIGGGNQRNGSNITITGGIVKANGGWGSAGIGGGNNGTCSNINITGGDVIARGGGYGVSIGAGKDGAAASGIYVPKATGLRVGSSDADSRQIAKDGTDIASDIVGTSYARTGVLDDIVYLRPVYKSEDEPASGIDHWDELIRDCYDVITDTTATLTNGWWVVKDNVTTTNLTVSGNVNIIVLDGVTLTANSDSDGKSGITVSGDGNSLTIYARSDGVNAGKIAATGYSSDIYNYAGAGIGSGYSGTKADAKNITINGCYVTAAGKGRAPGIGSAKTGDCDNIVINGGIVNASAEFDAAGIGGAGYGGNVTNITVNGGEVTATGGSAGGAGIGNGYEGSAGYITINGGKVNATANNDYCAAIGGGYRGNGEYITINGGEVTAISEKYGAGIGGGYGSYASHIDINGGYVYAKSDNADEGGAGIGGGYSDEPGFQSYGEYINITGGIVEAYGGIGAGIGGGNLGEGRNITVSGGIVTAVGGNDSAGIGGGNNASGKNISITGGEVTATSLKYGAGIGGGNEGGASDIAISGGTVYAKSRGNAIDGYSGAGIGGGSISFEDVTNIVITGNAKIFASSAAAAAIGLGYPSDGTASGIKVDSALTVLADNKAVPTTVIEHTGDEDITEKLASPHNANIGPKQEPVSYIYHEYKTANVPSSGVREDWVTAEADVYNLVTDETRVLTGGTWVVNGNVSTRALTVEGDVKLILTDGSSLEAVSDDRALAGITMAGNTNSLSVYAQSDGNNMGKLYAEGAYGSAGIGGSGSVYSANITFQGGNIEAVGGYGAAGIGGGTNSYASNIYFNSGIVTATGGSGAAGIGGGKGGYGTNIFLYGDMITANGGYGASAIGSGSGDAVSSNIYVSSDHSAKADATYPAATLIPHADAEDITASFNGKQYASVTVRVIPYLYPVYKTVEGTQAAVNGIDRWATGELTRFVSIAPFSTSEYVDLATGWYLVDGDVTTGALNCVGDVNIILADGAKLTAYGTASYAAISVSDTGSLTVYAQSEGDSMGEIVAYSSNKLPCIGVSDRNTEGIITVNGGRITATASGYAAAIGGSYSSGHKDVGGIVINGGCVKATTSGEGAAIGGASYGEGSNIVINGGTVEASSSYSGAAIGGGEAKSGRNITINGGNVIAKSTSGDAKHAGAAIGGGDSSSGEDITINGGKVEATSASGAAIGGGGSYTINDGTYAKNITINGGDVTATAGSGAAIGGGAYGYGQNIMINGGNVTATAGSGAAIGGGYNNYADGITITGGTVTAASGSGAGIGGGYSRYERAYAQNISITGGTVYATGGGSSAGIGGGSDGEYDGSTAKNISITGGLVIAKSPNGVSIGAGKGADTPASDITVDTSLSVAAGNSAADAYTVENTGADLAVALSTTKYARIGELGVVTYLDPVYNTAGNVASGIAGWESREIIGYDILTASTATLTDGFWVVSGDVNTASLTVSGNAKLILLNNASLTVTAPSGAGIKVTGDNSLTVYAQTAGPLAGKLNVCGGPESAAIGGASGEIGQNITINGGVITALAGVDAAAIGGGMSATGRLIVINGGTVNADSNAANGGWGAGIGGGYRYAGHNIIINGGKVNAIGGFGAGIGGGRSGEGYSIQVNAGHVTASAGNGAGIGGGDSARGYMIKVFGGGIEATSRRGDAVGNGYMCKTDSYGITVGSELDVIAGASSAAAVEIAEGHEDDTDIAPDLTGNRFVAIGGPHEHSWKYYTVTTVTANDTIQAVCEGDKGFCLDESNRVLTISYSSETGASLSADTLAGTDAEIFPVIMYIGTGDTQYSSSTKRPTKAGTYKAYITVGGAEAYAEFEIPHTHSWIYKGEGDTVTATCVGDGKCLSGENKTLTVSFNEETGKAELSADTLAGLAPHEFPTIRYVGNDYPESPDAPTKAGNYTAFIKVGDAAASVEFTVPHTHIWHYKAKDDTITAVCAGDGVCETDENTTLTISYNETTGKAELSSDTLAGVAPENFPVIMYEGTGNTEYAKSETAPTENGAYMASVTVKVRDGDAFESLIGDATASVKYVIGGYTVSFDSLGGSEVASQSVVKGECAVVPTAPTREGAQFDCWTLNGERFDFASAISSEITLTARWAQGKTDNPVVFSTDPENETTAGVKVISDCDAAGAGLETIATAFKGQAENKGNNVVVELKVNSVEFDSANAHHAAMKSAAKDSGRTEVRYLDVEMTKYINDTPTALTETESLVEIVVPFDTTMTKSPVVYRYHGDEMTVFTEAKPGDDAFGTDGTFYVTGSGKTAQTRFFTDSFSDYAIGYVKNRSGVSLSINGDIGVNVYLDADFFLTEAEKVGAYVVMKYNHNTKSYSTELTEDAPKPVDETTYDSKNKMYKFSCSVVSAQLCDAITATLYKADGTEVYVRNTSIKDYCMTALNSSNENLKALATAILDYGSTTQTYFKYNADNLANGGDYGGRLENAKLDDIPAYVYSDSEMITGVSFLALSQSAVRFYYDGEVENVTIDKTGDYFQAEKGENGSKMQYFGVTNIPGARLDEIFTLTLDGEKTVTGSALSYTKVVMERTEDENLKNLAKALVLYNAAAKAYFAK